MKEYPLEINFNYFNTRPPVVGKQVLLPQIHAARSVLPNSIQSAVDDRTCGAVAVWLNSLTTNRRSDANYFYKYNDDPSHALIASGSDSRYCFAPLLEDVWIHWRHKNPALIKESRLELFCRINGALRRIWTKIFEWDDCPENAKTQFKGNLKLLDAKDDEQNNPGLRSVQLGLQMATDNQLFPDDCVTAEFSPYQLKLSVVPKSDNIKKSPESVWMYFDIRVKLELFWGEEQMIPAERNDAVMPQPRKQVILPEEKVILQTLRDQDQGANFKIGTTNREIIIDANNFKEGHADEYHNDFVRTTELWGEGPRIPVIAEVKIKRSDGRIELCPRAIGNAKFLWDWEDTDDTQAHPKWRNWVDGAATQKTKDFLANIFQGVRDATDPLDTDNCPTSYGGKRAKGQHPFPIQNGYAPADVIRNGEFPFPIEACRQRKWAVFSKAWRTGALAGKTGVLFQPSRIAGDKYKLTVYLYYDGELDGLAKGNTFRPVAGDAHATAGFWEVFRRVNLTYIRRAGAAAVPLDPIKQLYKKELGMILQDTSDPLDEGRYQAALIKRFKHYNEDITSVQARKILPLCIRYAFKDPISQTGISPAVEVKSRDEFKQAVENAFQDYKIPGLEVSNANAFKLEEIEVNSLVNGMVVSIKNNLLLVLSDRGGTFQPGNTIKGVASKTNGTVTAVRASCWEKNIEEQPHNKDRQVKVVSGVTEVTIKWTPLRSGLSDGDRKELKRFLTTVANQAASNATVDIKVHGKYADKTDRERRDNVKNYLESLFTERFVIEKKSLLAEIVQQMNIYLEYFPTDPRERANKIYGWGVTGLMQDGFKEYVDRTATYNNKKGIYFFHFPGRDNLYKSKIAGASFPDSSRRDKAIVYITTIDDGTHLTRRETDNVLINYKNKSAVVAHEIAHALFIPHANAVTEDKNPGSPLKPGHHVHNDTCIMNYDMESSNFCGFCMLRLRGWDWKTMQKDFTFGVPEIRLAAAVGGKKSKSYSETYEGKKADPTDGQDDFHFAPEKETVNIEYKMNNPNDLVTSGKIELLKKSDGRVLWTRHLQPIELIHGWTQLPWNGKTAVTADFPDEYITAEHGPYTMQITIEGRGWGEPAKAWTNFEIQLAGIELEWGPKSVLAASPTLGTTTTERDHQVWDYLNDATANDNLQNRLPAAAETKKVYLVSNNFYTDTDQMTTNDPYIAHRTQWGDGPKIPLFAKLLIKKTDDTGIISPKALGNISCLWDWEDTTAEISGDPTVFDPNLAQKVDDEFNRTNAAERVPYTGAEAIERRNALYNKKADELFMQHTGQHYSVMKCLELTTDYHSALTNPPGLNCHFERGGKRGANAKPVFPAQAGIAPVASLAFPNDLVFPFNVRAANNRIWAAISTPWRSGDAQAEGRTGVVFQPSRIAGDNFKVSVYAGYNINTLDRADNTEINKVPANLKTSTGTFQIWREVHLAGYLKKKRHATAGLYASLDVSGVRRMADIDLTQIQQHYNQSFIRIANKTGGIQAMDRTNFINALTSAINALPWYIRAAVKTGNVGVEQYDNSDDGVVFKDHATFVTDIRLAAPGHPLDPDAFIKNMAPADVNPYAGGVYQDGPTFQYPNGIKSNLWSVAMYNVKGSYEGGCRTNWGRFVFLNTVEAYLGANRADGIYVVQVNELDNYEGPNGFSVPFPDQSPNSSFIAICGNKYSTGGRNTREQTLSHEIGHTLGLNHTDTPAGDPRRFHDIQGKQICLMSYNFDVLRAFCGTCLLRLRGWSIYRTDVNGVPQGSQFAHRTIWDNPECSKQPGGADSNPDVAIPGLSQANIDKYKAFHT